MDVYCGWAAADRASSPLLLSLLRSERYAFLLGQVEHKPLSEAVPCPPAAVQFHGARQKNCLCRKQLSCSGEPGFQRLLHNSDPGHTRQLFRKHPPAWKPGKQDNRLRCPCQMTPLLRNCLLMEDHSYLLASNSSQYFFASPQGTSSRRGAIFNTTPSLRSGSRLRSAARRSLSRNSYSSITRLS